MSHLKTVPTATNAQGIEHCPSLFSEEMLRQNPIILVSADLPCCGGTTVAERIGRQVLGQDFPLTAINVGDVIRKKLGATNEEELGRSLDAVDDPTVFDPEIYGSLPANKVCVIDGKLATTVGPMYIPPSRPVISIDLTSNLVTSAKRNLEREGLPLMGILTQDAHTLLARLSLLTARADHDTGMRYIMKAQKEDAAQNTQDSLLDPEAQDTLFSLEAESVAMSIRINTNSMCKEEILAYFSGNPDDTKFDKFVPKWELTALRDTLATLNYLRVIFDENTHPSDRQHFAYQYEFARYNIDRLTTTRHPAGLRTIREDIKKALVDCWFGLMMKQVPRFFEDADGNISLDEVSHAWTPEYYKVAEAWPVLKTLLKGKNILDPFGGAGTLVNLLAARGVIRKAVLSDISYYGGQSIDKHGHTYATELNAQMSHVLFDNLPSWYKPNLDVIEDRVQADATHLPFRDGSFDFVVTDPPYGKNHDSGGIGLTIGCLPEFERVTTRGTIMMLPIKSANSHLDWPTEIKNAGFPVELLTTDVSRKQSAYPVCYAKIGHRDKK